MTFEPLNDTNFLLYAAKHYDNPCHNTEEFLDDLKRFKYLKRLFVKYKETGELKDRLILNHIIVLYNIFGDSATSMLFLKLKGFEEYLKPFIVLLNRLPIKVLYSDIVIYTTEINMDKYIVDELRKI
jgi:hypothetical protein